MAKSADILLVGIGGYGNLYVNALLGYRGDKKFNIKGIVDPYPENSKYYNEIKGIGVPVFNTMDEFYSQFGADLAVISSPIQFHCEQACFAMLHGSNVLCEKPICATTQDALKMIETRDKTGKFLAIGYQWSFSNAVLQLKSDVTKGVLGKPVRLKTLVLWPRDERYYRRGWAGKKTDGSGRWVLDSIANNATAHYLFNMFYILGKDTDRSAVPSKVYAELYRANAIENFDTAAMRTYVEDGTELLYYASHAVSNSIGPDFRYEFGNAVVTYSGSDGSDKNIIAKFNDGTEKNYGSPGDNEMQKLWTCIDAVSGEAAIPCGPEAAMSHTMCINAMQDSMPEIRTFPGELVKFDTTARITWVEGLGDTLTACYEKCIFPSDTGASWAAAGKEIKL